MATAEDVKNSSGIGNGRTRLIGLAVAALVLWHGVGSAVDQAGMIGLGFASPYRSSDAMSDEALALAATGDTEGALRIARMAIRQQPVHQSSVRILAEIESGLDTPLLDTLGNPHLKTAGLLGWRDSQSQAKLMMVGLSEADRPLVIDRMDALLRRREISSESFQLVSLMLRDAELRGLLADRLLENPPWRSELFVAVQSYGSEETTRAMADLLLALDRRSVEIIPDEKHSIYNSLLVTGQAETLSEVADQLESGAQLLADLDFAAFAQADTDPDSVLNPFGWQLGRAKRTVVSIENNANQSTHGVLLVRTSSRITAPVITQVLRLNSGSYSFSSQQKSDRPDGLTWSITCADENIASQKISYPQSDGWARHELDFLVPDDCPIQSISLVTGRNLSGNSYQSQFKEISISPL